jgi:hypothetical protein
MNQNFKQSDSQPTEAEHTLRLLANLPPPEGLTDRVHRRLKAAPAPGRFSFLTGRRWTAGGLGYSSMRLQFAGAALAIVVLAGGTWGVFHLGSHGQAGASAQPASNSANPGGAAGGFSNAKAVRVPPTLKPLHVPPAPKKKPNAGHAAKSALKPAADSASQQAPAQP